MAKAKAFLIKYPVWTMLMIVVLGLCFMGAKYFGPEAETLADFGFFRVEKGDFQVTIVEGGNLDSTKKVTLSSEMEWTTQIKFIVPEGTYVKEGDKMVEFETGNLPERIKNQRIAIIRAENELGKAKEEQEVKKMEREIEDSQAALDVEFAEADLEKYQYGDYPMQKRSLMSTITLAREEIQRASDRMSWTKKLLAKDYATMSELKADELKVKTKELAISQYDEELRLLEKYAHPKQLQRYKSAFAQSKLNKIRTLRATESYKESFKSRVKSHENSLKQQKEKLEEFLEQEKKSRLIAPQDVLVVYASSSRLVDKGEDVRPGQSVIVLPDTTQMMVEIMIHESHIRDVKPGMDAIVKIDALPDRSFKGRVKKVAPLPDSRRSYYEPDLKIYNAEVWIEDELPDDLRPGVSARAEIAIASLTNVLRVPIQSVTTVKGQTVCYVKASAGGLRRVKVEIGHHNDQYIEIISGLSVGDEVSLAPPYEDEGLGSSEDEDAKPISPPAQSQ